MKKWVTDSEGIPVRNYLGDLIEDDGGWLVKDGQFVLDSKGRPLRTATAVPDNLASYLSEGCWFDALMATVIVDMMNMHIPGEEPGDT